MRPPTVGSVLAFSLFVFVLLSLWSRVLGDTSSFYTDCWEGCLSSDLAFVGSGGSSGSGSGGSGGSPSGSSLRAEYNQIYRMIEAARTVRLTSGTNSTLMILDATLVPGTSNLDINSFQKLLAQILLIALPVTTSYNPFYFVLFDGSQAWYKQSWEGLGRCDAFNLLSNLKPANLSTANLTTGLPSGLDSGVGGSANPSLIERACLVGAQAMNLLQSGNLANPIYDVSFVHNPIVFGFVNRRFETFDSKCGGSSDIFGNNHRHRDLDESVEDTLLRLAKGFNEVAKTAELVNPGSDFNPYCARYFKDRFIVGTGDADHDDMEAWASISPDIVDGSFFMDGDSDFVTAAEQIAACMKANCCPANSTSRSYGSSVANEGACIMADAEENFQICDSATFLRFDTSA